MISGGLDCTVKLWDLRRLPSSLSSGSGMPAPVQEYHCGKSVNSAFFSPSGRAALATTMNNKLDIMRDFHLPAGSDRKPVVNSIPHDNRTGRWLSTFMAQFHPALDIFCVGSMQQPRRIQLYDADDSVLLRDVTGDAMTAVASRCCFHPRTDRLILVGGNSSGRVTVVR
jgi:WD repeat-containing protein 76